MTLFGIWHNNYPVLPADMEVMKDAINNRYIDETHVWHNFNIGMGQKTIFNTTESLLESLPHHNAEHNITIEGDIRLDNRPELFAKLGIAHAMQHTFGDAHLIIAAYLKWGEYCPEHLLGDFAFALWDGNKKKLFCCTDHFNKKGLYYFYNGKRFVFASAPQIIYALDTKASGLNYNKLLPQAYPQANFLFFDECWYKNIYPIPAGTILTVDSSGLTKRRYWTPEVKEPLVFTSEDEYREAFQELIFRVVGDYLRSNFPVTSTLSGGLDSSSIVAVAAAVLAKQNRGLQVFSAVLPNGHDPALTDERYYADMLKKFPNVNINYITAPGKGFASDLEELLKMSAEPSLISRHYLNTAFIQKARELGSRTILYGVHGELGLTGYPMGAFAELFAQLKWARLWREINRHGKIKNKPIGQIVKTEVIKPFLPLFLQKRFSGQMQEIKPAKFSYFTADFAEVLKDKLKDSENLKWKLPAGIVPNHRQNQVETIRIVQNKMRGHAINQEVESRSPLMDVRLLDFCLAAPIEFKIKNGYDRSLARIGLDKILPPEIQWRTTKSPFSPDYHERYNQQLPVVKQYLNAIEPNDPIRKMIDVDKLKTTANLAVANNEQHAVAKEISRDSLPQALYLIEFLRRFEEFKS